MRSCEFSDEIVSAVSSLTVLNTPFSSLIKSSRPRFEFLPETKEDEIEPAFIEFRIENNEITGSTFLKITDFSSMDDKEELAELWSGLVHTLKERIGG